MKVQPSIEGLRHLRGQGWTYEKIAEQSDVWSMLRNAPVSRRNEEGEN
ncbi:hypothetical protein OG243_13665 [Streptomyces sp. NBC_01318]|nr:hypothetical protein OG243_13665 [Streptomyces sp. NBC_01318]